MHEPRDYMKSVERIKQGPGAREDRSLGEALGGLGIEVHLLGDCDGVGYIEGAMLGAARVAGNL